MNERKKQILILRRNKNENLSHSYARDVIFMPLNIYETYSDHIVLVLSSILANATEHIHVD